MLGSRLLLAILVLFVGLWRSGHAIPPIHTVIPTECGNYFTWQSIGIFYSHRKVGQPGKITRVACCTPEEAEKWKGILHVVPTHIAPSYTVHPKTKDVYSAYNKPLAVIDFLAKNKVEEEYILVIDADMIFVQVFDPIKMGVQPGWAVSAYFSYMQGVYNQLALKHIPEVAPRNDTLAGPKGRRGDMCGGFTFMTRDDLSRVAPLWLKFTEDVRFDDEAWKYSGDQYAIHPGDKPWISEMYGYAYGAAKANVWHIANRAAMEYPEYDLSEPPMVMHYGLQFNVPGTDFTFDKHWHYDFKAMQCPPWTLHDKGKRSNGGLLNHPPLPSTLKSTGLGLMRDLYAIYAINTINEALCERHLMHCPTTQELVRECSHVHQISEEVNAGLAKLEKDGVGGCADGEPRCPKWQKDGECEKNPTYMQSVCRLSCHVCQPTKFTGKLSNFKHLAWEDQLKQVNGTEEEKPKEEEKKEEPTQNRQPQEPKETQEAPKDADKPKDVEIPKTVETTQDESTDKTDEAGKDGSQEKEGATQGKDEDVPAGKEEETRKETEDDGDGGRDETANKGVDDADKGGDKAGDKDAGDSVDDADGTGDAGDAKKQRRQAIDWDDDDDDEVHWGRAAGKKKKEDVGDEDGDDTAAVSKTKGGKAGADDDGEERDVEDKPRKKKKKADADKEDVKLQGEDAAKGVLQADADLPDAREQAAKEADDAKNNEIQKKAAQREQRKQVEHMAEQAFQKLKLEDEAKAGRGDGEDRDVQLHVEVPTPKPKDEEVAEHGPVKRQAAEVVEEIVREEPIPLKNTLPQRDAELNDDLLHLRGHKTGGRGQDVPKAVRQPNPRESLTQHELPGHEARPHAEHAEDHEEVPHPKQTAAPKGNVAEQDDSKNGEFSNTVLKLRLKCVSDPQLSVKEIQDCLAAASELREYSALGVGNKQRHHTAGDEEEHHRAKGLLQHAAGGLGFMIWCGVGVLIFMCRPHLRRPRVSKEILPVKKL